MLTQPLIKKDHRLLISPLPPGKLQPAGLINSLTEPLSGNLVLQVTPYTSLKLNGRTAELPRGDFNRRVIRFTRHPLLLFTS